MTDSNQKYANLEDDKLLEALAVALAGTTPIDGEVEPPASVRAGSLWVHEWATADEELAIIAAGEKPVGVRSAAGIRTVALEAESSEIELEITITPGQMATLKGQLLPGQWGKISVLAGGRLYTTEIDEKGRFLLEGIPTGRAAALVTIEDAVIRLDSIEI